MKAGVGRQEVPRRKEEGYYKIDEPINDKVWCIVAANS